MGIVQYPASTRVTGSPSGMTLVKSVICSGDCGYFGSHQLSTTVGPTAWASGKRTPTKAVGTAAALLMRPAVRPAPDFTITLPDGTDFTLSANRGKVVVMDFMYINCPSCKLAESALKAVYWSYRNDSRYVNQFETVSFD